MFELSSPTVEIAQHFLRRTPPPALLTVNHTIAHLRPLPLVNVYRVKTGLIPSSQRTWTHGVVAGELLRQGAGPLQQGRQPEQHGRGGVSNENEGPLEDCGE